MKIKLHVYAAIVFTIAQSFLASGQDSCQYQFIGQVLEKESGAPLAHANIYLDGTGKGTTTDDEGHFLLKGLCAGQYTMLCSHISCSTITVAITINGNTHRKFYLEHIPHELEGFTIKAPKPQQPSPLNKTKIKGRELERTKGLSLGESLKQVTGVNSLRTGNAISKPIIHGLHSNRVLILNNGVRQEGQQWGSEHGPEIDPFLANNITVIKGAAGVQYGSDAIGGVILVEPSVISPDTGISGELNLVGMSNGRQGMISSMIQGRSKYVPALGWRLQGTLKKSGNIKTPNYYLRNSGYEEYNFSGTIDYNKENYGTEFFYSQFNTNIAIFSGAHIGNLTDLLNAFEREEPIPRSGFSYTIQRPFQHIEHELLKVKSWIKAGPKDKLHFTYARQYNLRYEYDSDRPLNDSIAALNLPELQLEITTHTADLHWDHQLAKGVKGKVGVSAINQGNTHAGRFFIPNFITNGAGVYWLEQYQRGFTTWEAGVRYDQEHLQVFIWEDQQLNRYDYRFQNVSGSLGFIRKLNADHNLRVNLGSAWRPPAINELFSNGLHHGAAAIEIGNRNLDTEKAYNLSTSITRQGKSKFNGSIEAYLNWVNDFIYLQPTLTPTLTIRGAFPTFRFRQTDVLLRGIDLSLSYQLTSNLSWQTKASIVRASEIENNDPIIGIPADRFEHSLQYESKTSRAMKPYITLSWLQVLRQTRVLPNSDYVPPPAGYQLLDLAVGTDLTLQGKLIKIHAGIQNLTNKQYRDYLNRFRYYADEQGRNYTLKLIIPFT